MAGFVVYKFVLGAGETTAAGGTIKANLYFRGDPSGSQGSNAFFGVNNTLVAEGSLNGISNSADFKDITMQSLFTPNAPEPYDTYTATDVTLAIPEGLTEFYVMFADEYGSGRIAFGALNVSANINPVPEPVSMSLLGMAGLVLMRRRCR